MFGLFALITVLTGSDFPRDYKSKNPPVIHLYGETHGKKEFYDIEFEAWKNYYEKDYAYFRIVSMRKHSAR